jgi:hypothetical protein
MTERVLSRVWSIGILPDALHSDLFNASSAARCVARFECLGWFRNGDDEPEADIDTHPDEAAMGLTLTLALVHRAHQPESDHGRQ